jgi:hypothetical protein
VVVKVYPSGIGYRGSGKEEKLGGRKNSGELLIETKINIYAHKTAICPFVRDTHL